MQKYHIKSFYRGMRLFLFSFVSDVANLHKNFDFYVSYNKNQDRNPYLLLLKRAYPKCGMSHKYCPTRSIPQKKVKPMKTVCGLDVHKDSVFVCILNENGVLFQENSVF